MTLVAFFKKDNAFQEDMRKNTQNKPVQTKRRTGRVNPRQARMNKPEMAVAQ